MKQRINPAIQLRQVRESLAYDVDYVLAGLAALIDDKRPSIAKATYFKWERGEQFPHDYWIRRLCMFFHKTPEELGLLRVHQAEKKKQTAPSIILQRYLQTIYAKYGTVHLPIGPSFSLEAVYQPLQLVTAPPTHVGDDKWQPPIFQDMAADQESRDDTLAYLAMNGEDIFAHSPHNRMIILGGPGAGKSTLLKHFIGMYAKRCLQTSDTLLPIFISLPDFSRSGKSFKAYLLDLFQDMMIEDTFAEAAWQSIQNGTALVCLDSLDEVFEGRSAVIQKIDMLMATSHPHTVWMISSRFTDYRSGQFSGVQVTEWKLLPMEYPHQKGLAQRLIGELQRRLSGIVKNDADEFMQTLSLHPRMTIWSKNPLLFSLAVILYVRTGTLPESRVELYMQAIEAIIELREPDMYWRSTLIAIYAALAFKLFHTCKGRSFTVAEFIALLRIIREEQKANWREDIAAFKVGNAGVIEIQEGVFSFLHQTFQEYLSGYYVADLPFEQACHAAEIVIERIHEPIFRQILIELVFIVNGQNQSLEEYIYTSILKKLELAKMEMLENQRAEELSHASAVTEGIDAILQALVDVWGYQLCESLERGASYREVFDRLRDGEIASVIASVFERNPRAFMVPALVRGLSLYPKRGRFVGALGEIGTPEAQEALYVFAVREFAERSDPPLLHYIVIALGQARVVQSIPLLEGIRDDPSLDIRIRYQAHFALKLMDRPSLFDEQVYFNIERIVEDLRIGDEQGRPSDWRIVAQTAQWIYRYPYYPTLIAHQATINQMLEFALDHKLDAARRAVVNALGVIGKQSSFMLLLQRLGEHIEPSYDVCILALRALERLTEREQITLSSVQLKQYFLQIRTHYPALTEEAMRTEARIRHLLHHRKPVSEASPTIDKHISTEEI